MMVPNGSAHIPVESYVPQKSQSIPAHVINPGLCKFDSRNWLIHYHFCRREFGVCKLIINEEIENCIGKAEVAHFVKGLVLRQEGKVQESLECFQKCCALNPRNEDVLKQMARSLYLLGRQKLAMDAFNEARIAASKPEWDVHHNLGLCLVNMGELEKGREHLRQAIQLNKHENSFLALAKVHIAEGDLQGAVEIYRVALDTYPDSVDLAVALALLYMDLSDHANALDKFGTALALDPSCVKALLAVGALLQGHGELDVALSKYKSATGYMPESASLWNNLGMCFFGKKRFVSAVSCLKRANSLAPFDWKILLNLGLVHLATQQYASAFHFLSSAVNLSPTSGALFLPLAVTLVHLGDRTNARYAFEEAVASTSDSAAAAINYSLFLLEEGNESGAVAMYNKFQSEAERVPGIEGEVMELANKVRELLFNKEAIHDTSAPVAAAALPGPSSAGLNKPPGSSSVVSHPDEILDDAV